MDLATTKGGTLASIPARLLHGKGVGREAFPQRGVLAAQDPQFGSSGRRRAIWKGKVGKLKRYRKSCQTFPLQLPPAEEQDAQTRLFGEL
jgi:hypothetical protein